MAYPPQWPLQDNFLDMVRLKSSHAIENWQPVAVRKITPEAVVAKEVAPSASATCGRDPEEHFKWAVRVSARDGIEFDFIADEVIRCTGWNYVPSRLFDESIKPETWKDGRLPVLSKDWESVNVPNLFFLGTTMKSCDRQSASGFIHGFRYLIRTQFHQVEQRLHGVPLPFKALQFSPADITAHVTERLSHSSALWQLFHFLCDVVVANPATGEVRIYEEVRIDWVHEGSGFLEQWPVVFVYCFDFGEHRYEASQHPTPFGQVTPASKVACGVNIHPLLKAFADGKYTQSLQLKVTLDGHWGSADSTLAIQHFLNTLLKQDDLEPNVAQAFDFLKAPKAQEKVNEEDGLLVPPAKNEAWLSSRGYITGPGFDTARPCTLPRGDFDTARIADLAQAD